MRRIAIVGCSGGGKSTLARALGLKLGLPVIHLDTLFWKPGWVESEPAPFRQAVEAAVAGEGWISDGNFITDSALRLARADTVVWIEPPMALCLWRALWRAVTAFGRTRSDLATGCSEKVDLGLYRYIWTWSRLMRPKMQEAIETHASGARLVRLKSDAEVAAFLASATPAPEDGLLAGYRAMAADGVHEQEAEEWCEALIRSAVGDGD